MAPVNFKPGRRRLDGAEFGVNGFGELKKTTRRFFPGCSSLLLQRDHGINVPGLVDELWQFLF